MNDLTGQLFGNLTVLGDSGERFHRSVVWRCRCSCGKEVNVPAIYLKDGSKMDCGKDCPDRKPKARKKTELKSYKTESTKANKTSPRRGVILNKNVGKWEAYLDVDRKRIYLGIFQRMEDAIKAREEAEMQYYPDRVIAARRKNVIRERVCRQCGSSFEGGPRAWYCPTCRAVRARQADARYKAKGGPDRALGSINKCVRCGKEYIVNSARQKYCPDCAYEGVREADRPASRQWNQEHKETYYPEKNAKRNAQRKKNPEFIRAKEREYQAKRRAKKESEDGGKPPN